MAVPSLGAIAASFTVLLRAACREKLPRASPEFNLSRFNLIDHADDTDKTNKSWNLMVLTMDFEGPRVNVRVALQSREAANILDLERFLY